MEPTNSSPPIFIVGVPRSGTTLLSTLLSRHSQLNCGIETDFFSQIKRRDLEQALRDPLWPKVAVEKIQKLDIAGQPVHKFYCADDVSLYNYLRKRSPSPQVMLEALTAHQTQARGKNRWVEKSPSHLLHLKTIRHLYPTAQIIRIVRDPRASAHSMTKVPWGSQSAVANAYEIYDWIHRSDVFFRTDSGSYTLQYEQLVQLPTETLRKLCDFLREDFEVDMLNSHPSDDGVKAPHEDWKNNTNNILDPSRINAWRQELTPESELIINNLFQEYLCDYGYRDEFTPLTTLLYGLNISKSFVENQLPLLISLSKKKIRVVPINSKEQIKISQLLICDLPDLYKGKKQAIIAVFQFLKTMTLSALKCERIKYSIHCQKSKRRNSMLGILISQLLKSIGTRYPDENSDF